MHRLLGRWSLGSAALSPTSPSCPSLISETLRVGGEGFFLAFFREMLLERRRRCPSGSSPREMLSVLVLPSELALG